MITRICITAVAQGGPAGGPTLKPRFAVAVRFQTARSRRTSMTGNKHSGVLIQPRDLQLLRELATMRLIDREQAKIVAGFRSTTRANLRLLKLTRAGVLNRFFSGSDAGGRKAVYALTRAGAVLVQAPFRVLQRKPGSMLIGDL